MHIIPPAKPFFYTRIRVYVIILTMKKITIIAIIALLFTGCTAKKELAMYSNTTVSAGFDTYISIKASAYSKEEFDTYFNSSIENFIYLNKLFDIYHTYDGINNLKSVNDNAGIQPLEVDPILIEMLSLAKEYYDLSNGEFDITLGPVLKIWHEYRTQGLLNMAEGKSGSTPSLEELQEAYKCVGWQYVEIDKTNNTVFLNNACASLDVGGIAKGFSTEYVAEKLEENNIAVGIVDAGGNNRTINSKLDNTPWRVGIQSPTGSADSIIAVTIDGSMSFVTSGDYQRYYLSEDGNTYHHIIDPSTLFPADYYNSVSIITDDSGIADALSTTLFTVDFETGNQIIDEFRKNNPDSTLEVIWIMTPEKKVDTQYIKEKNGYYIAYTSGLENKIIWE